MKSLFESTLVVNPLGKQGSEYVIEINGKKYGYSCSDEIYRKFLKIMQFSAGRALAWFKKNTTLKTKLSEGAAGKVVKCKMKMPDFVKFRDILSEDYMPNYWEFIADSNFPASAVQNIPMDAFNKNPKLFDFEFWTKIVARQKPVTVEKGRKYEIVFDNYNDAIDDFVIGFVGFDDNHSFTCYSIPSKVFEKMKVTITSYYLTEF